MIIETSTNYQMVYIMGAGPFYSGLYVIRKNISLDIIHKGDKVFIEHKWRKLHESSMS